MKARGAPGPGANAAETVPAKAGAAVGFYLAAFSRSTSGLKDMSNPFVPHVLHFLCDPATFKLGSDIKADVLASFRE